MEFPWGRKWPVHVLVWRYFLPRPVRVTLIIKLNPLAITLAPSPLPLPRHYHLLPQVAFLAPALPFSLLVEEYLLCKCHPRPPEPGPRSCPWWRPEPLRESHSHVQRLIAPSGGPDQAHTRGIPTIHCGLRLFGRLR